MLWQKDIGHGCIIISALRRYCGMKKVLMLALMLLPMVVLNGQTGLIISELMYQPHSGEAEYVELYNNTDGVVQLSDYEVIRWVSDSLGRHYALPVYEIGAHDYVVLTKDAASVSANYRVKYVGKVVECSMPTYPNGGGSVIICRAADSVIVDRFDYQPSMHSRLLRNKAGVALERRSFSKPTNAAGNWFSASSMVGYGTPGYENSQSMETLVEERLFVFLSSVVSPDGDGYQDVLEIDYEVDDGELMGTVDVFDARGARVRKLINNFLLGTHGTIVWDGLDDDNRTLPHGHYVVQITIYNIEGTQQVVKRAVAIL